MNSFFRALARKKIVRPDETSKLKRVLGLWDLTFLGLGVTLGLGTYVLAGSVAKIHAGPAVCLSFLIAAIASTFAGLCYAEFACRVPKAGSAYIYSYVTMGEFVAYIIGWNLVLEYVIGIAGLARGLSDYINALTNNTISGALQEAMPINIDFLSSYPEFLSFLIMIVLIIVMSNGAKESSILNIVLTSSNIVVVLVVVIFGSTVVNTDLWKIPKEKIPEGVKGGEGGFLPFGLAGLLAGAGRCFFAFAGFDAVATAADEAKNPKKIIPLGIILCLFISFLAYFGVSTVLTLMCPYYEQDEKAPFPYAFEYVDRPSMKWVATIGAIFAMTSTLVGGMFALPRILYSMALDGLLFKQLSYVSKRTSTPVVATVVTGLSAGVMATIFNINQLVEMLSIGTLLAYSIVSLCVLMLRYKPDNEDITSNIDMEMGHNNFIQSSYNGFKILFNLNGNKFPNKTTSNITNWMIAVFCLLSIIVCICARIDMFTSVEEPVNLAIFVLMILLLVMSVVVIGRQPEQEIDLPFKIPCVPITPCISIFINITLMLTSQIHTYIRLLAWLAIGLVIYFAYGIWHSKERNADTVDQKNATKTATSEKPVITTRL